MKRDDFCPPGKAPLDDGTSVSWLSGEEDDGEVDKSDGGSGEEGTKEVALRASQQYIKQLCQRETNSRIIGVDRSESSIVPGKNWKVRSYAKQTRGIV